MALQSHFLFQWSFHSSKVAEFYYISYNLRELDQGLDEILTFLNGQFDQKISKHHSTLKILIKRDKKTLSDNVTNTS